MRIVFAGTGSFALPALQALIGFCHQFIEYKLVGVYTKSDRPSGRGRSLQASVIKQCAEQHQLPVFQPISLKKKETQQVLEQLQPDLIVVAAYGLLLPEAVLGIPRFGCMNIHGSLLPKWRGAAPIQRSLLAGDSVTGVTIMQMDAGLDTGPILYQVSQEILPEETAATLEIKLADLGAIALITTIQEVVSKQKNRQSQPETGHCYASKLSKNEGEIAWSDSALYIERQIRAFNPWPMSFTWLKGEKIRIWEAVVEPAQDLTDAAPGTMVAISKLGITVATGKGYLRLTQLQREGGRCLSVVALLNGSFAHLRVGMLFCKS